MLESKVICPECGEELRPELIRCTECHAYVHDVSPWRSDYNLLAIPITLVLWFGLDLLLRLEKMPTQAIFGHPISRLILGLGIYGLLVLGSKLWVTWRQAKAFRIVRQACASDAVLGSELLETVRERIRESGLGAFNTLLAYNRLQWLVEVAQAPAAERAGMVNGLRQHSETDWESLDNSFATSRFLVWLLPTTGFLGTVWGMTLALRSFAGAVGAGGSDIKFKVSLLETSQGLGVAFYTTLVGLAAVIPVLFLATVGRRRAQHFLERLDKFFIRGATQVITQPQPPPPEPPAKSPARRSRAAAKAKQPKETQEDAAAETKE